MIVKNFEGTGIEIDNNEYFRIKWDYISLQTGEEIGPRSFYVPNNLITEEWILGWDLQADLPVFLSVENAVLNPAGIWFIAWYTDTFFLEYYFIESDNLFNSVNLKLKVPNSYKQDQPYGLISKNILFRFKGKNYPGQNNLSNKTVDNKFPGLKQGTNSLQQDSIRPSIEEALTSYLTSEISKQDINIRNSWETTFGPNSGSEFSLNMLGLDREDYSFVKSEPALIKDIAIASLPTTNNATNYLYIIEYDNQIVHSLNDISNFKYGAANNPADIALTVVDSNRNFQLLYLGNQSEGTVITYTLANKTKQINITADRYEPEIALVSAILPSQFKKGYKYKYPITQTQFPTGFISTSSSTGKYPETGVRPWNVKPLGFLGLFNAKNTQAAIEFLFKLFKLREGQEYSVVTNTIFAGPKDFEPLKLNGLPTSLVEGSASNNLFIADSILGDTTNQVFIRLPFDYKRNQKEWKLAQDICSAFLQNYTIGYHQFVADFSCADEPVFSRSTLFVSEILLSSKTIIENVLDPAINLSGVNANINTFGLVLGYGDNNRFSIVGASLIFNGLANYEAVSSYQIKIKVDSIDGISYEQSEIVLVMDVNEAPTNLIVSGFIITQPIGLFDSSPYITTSITPSGNISADSNNRLAYNGPINPAQFAHIGTFINSVTQQAFTAVLLLENNPIPTAIAELSNNDPDAVVSSTYALIPGPGSADNAAFSIQGASLIINVSTDYEIKKEYSVRLRVTTNGGLFTESVLRINIVQRPEYPTNIFLSSNIIGAINQAIGTLSTEDPDSFSSFTYSISGGSLAAYLGLTNNVLRLVNNLSGNETEYTVIIRATDESGLFIEKTFNLLKVVSSPNSGSYTVESSFIAPNSASYTRNP